MSGIQRRLLALLLSLGIALGLVACGSEASKPGSALVNVRSQALSGTDVDHVQVTVSGGGINPAIIATLAGSAAFGWSGVVGEIPAGPGRRFAVEAIDGGGTVLYAGDAEGVTIQSGTQAYVVIVLQQVKAPVPFENAAPRFRSLSVSTLDVVPGGSVTLSADAFDPNPEDVLTYSWAGEGTFGDSASPTTTWIAPRQDGAYQLTISVADPKKASASLSVFIKVFTPNGSAQVDVSLNGWPVVASLVPEPSRIDVGESTLLRLAVSDPDGDPLTVSWTSNCTGSFNDAALVSPTFTLTALAPDGCQFTAVISDGRGGTNTARIAIPTGPGIAPTVGSGGTSGSGGSGGSGGATGGGDTGGAANTGGTGGGGSTGGASSGGSGGGSTGGAGGGSGGSGGGVGRISCWFTNADSTPAAFVANGLLYSADGVAIGRFQASTAYFADSALAGYLGGETIFNGDGSVRGFHRASFLYNADGSLLATVATTVRRADGSLAGQTGCQEPATTFALTLFGVFSL